MNRLKSFRAVVVAATTIFLSASRIEAQAQIDPLGAQLYQNRYLGNPAFAGTAEDLTFNLGYRNQLNGIPGSPVTYAFTTEYRVNRVGVGVNLFNERAGLLSRTRAVATYAYHLPLGEEQQVSFGLSLGMMNLRLSTENIDGHAGDVDAANYNARGISAEGDFGIVYSNMGFTVQASLPGMGRLLREEDRNTANHVTFFSAVSYRYNPGQGDDSFFIEPRIGYREIKGLKDVLDVGARLAFLDGRMSLMANYQSNSTTLLGMAYSFENRVAAHLMYTAAASSAQGVRGNRVELNLTVPVSFSR